MINIGRDNKDGSFRYRMPSLVAKVEGSGNGIKTAIVNMQEVASALRVHPSHPTKFFATELGAVSTCTQDKTAKGATIRAIVNGQHSTADLAKLLDKYIRLYVLCPKCTLPELHTKLTKSKKSLEQTCVSCGTSRKLSADSSKFVKFMISNPLFVDPPAGAAKSSHASFPTHEQPPSSISELDAKESAWHTDTSKEAQQKRALEEFETVRTTATATATAPAAATVNVASVDAGAGAARAALAVASTMDGKHGLSTTMDVKHGSFGPKEMIGKVIHDDALCCAELRRLSIAHPLTMPTEWCATVLDAWLSPIHTLKVLVGRFKERTDLWNRLLRQKLANPDQFLNALDTLWSVRADLLKIAPHLVRILYEDTDMNESDIKQWYLTRAKLPRFLARVPLQPMIEWLDKPDE